MKVFNILKNIGVDCIEVGFPAASLQEEKIIRNLCAKVSNSDMSICVFARALEKDILIAKEVTKNLKNAKIQIVSPVSDLQIKYSVNANKEQIIMQLKEKFF